MTLLRPLGSTPRPPPAVVDTPVEAPKATVAPPQTAAPDRLVTRNAGQAVLTAADVASTGAPVTAGATLRGRGLFTVAASEVQRVRSSGDPAAMARVLHHLTTDRSNILFANDQVRMERMNALVGGLDVKTVEAVRAHYVAQFGCDPETHIRSWDLGQPLARLHDDLALEMVAALNGPRLAETAGTMGTLLQKAKAGTLTAQDRKTYFSTMPRVGLWNPPLRDDAKGMDAMERKILAREFAKVAPGVSIDDAMILIESKMPPPDLSTHAPREKSVAVIVSSAGAQWQEMMDFAMKMHAAGYSLQVFTPDGRPAAFQEDSMCVDGRTAPLGHGCPPHLDPAGEAGKLASEILGTTAGARDFDPSKFGAVFAAGGLGFNEDVAAARSVVGADGKKEVVLKANSNIEGMMRRALDARLPEIAICHGPTLYAAVQMKVNGKDEPVAKGLETASLPPFEGYVGLTGRKEKLFTLDVNTHGELAETGARTSVVKDVANMQRVVTSEKAGIEFVTGPGPQASAHLADAAMAAMKRRWG